MTDARLMVGIIGAPESGEFAIEIGALVGEFRGAQPVDRFRARLLANLHQLVADLVDRLVPTQLGPLAVDQLHRIFQAAIAVHELARRLAFGAVRATIVRRAPAGLLADPNPVRHFGDHRAADRTMRADVLADGALRAGRRDARFCLAHASERQRAGRRETAGGEAGAAQESAAIETTIGVALQCAGERSATSLTVCSLDQHRPLPQLGYRLTR